MQGIDLGPALMLVLVAHSAGQGEQGDEEGLELAVALDLAADIPDQPAQPGAQELEHPPGPLELVGMDIARRP